MKPIAKLLSLNLLKTLLISAGVSALVVSVLDVHPFVFIGVVMYNTCMLFSSLSVFLNVYEPVRESPAYSALSFFLLPVITLILLSVEMGGFVFGLPFLYVHLYYFLKFRKIDIGFRIKTKISAEFIFTAVALLAIAGIYWYSEATHEANSDYYQGYVFDENEKPLPGVKVREKRHYDKEAVTDSTGYFRLYRSSTLEDLTFSKEGYLSDTARTLWHQHGETTEYSFLRTPGSIILKKDTTATASAPVTLHWKHIEGNWVLKEYYDYILQFKSIARYRLNPLAEQAWALRIKQDSLFSAGLIYGYRIACNTHSDTLVYIDTYEEKFALLYDLKSDLIIARNTGKPKEKFTYRRATGELNNILSSIPFDFEMWDSMSELFTKRLIEGTYAPVAGGPELVLSKNGSLKGFKGYNTYQVHCFFGPSHPCGNNDAIIFEDSTTYNFRMYNWKFLNDTLRLTEMHTPNGGDSYYVGTRFLEYIKK